MKGCFSIIKKIWFTIIKNDSRLSYVATVAMIVASNSRLHRDRGAHSILYTSYLLYVLTYNIEGYTVSRMSQSQPSQTICSKSILPGSYTTNYYSCRTRRHPYPNRCFWCIVCWYSASWSDSRLHNRFDHRNKCKEKAPIQHYLC